MVWVLLIFSLLGTARPWRHLQGPTKLVGRAKSVANLFRRVVVVVLCVVVLVQVTLRLLSLGHLSGLRNCTHHREQPPFVMG